MIVTTVKTNLLCIYTMCNICVVYLKVKLQHYLEHLSVYIQGK